MVIKIRRSWIRIPQSLSLPSCGPTSLSSTNDQMGWFGNFLALRLTLLKALANEDTLLPTQMFPRLPARAAFPETQKMFLIFVAATNVSQFAQHENTTFILCPAFLRAQKTWWATMCPQQCVLVCQGVWIISGGHLDVFAYITKPYIQLSTSAYVFHYFSWNFSWRAPAKRYKSWW